MAILIKPLYGTHENRLPCDGNKLLGQLAAHTHTLTTCHNDNVIHDMLQFGIMIFVRL